MRESNPQSTSVDRLSCLPEFRGGYGSRTHAPFGIAYEAIEEDHTFSPAIRGPGEFRSRVLESVETELLTTIAFKPAGYSTSPPLAFRMQETFALGAPCILLFLPSR